MKPFTMKCIALSLFSLSLAAPCVFAKEPVQETQEGILQATRHLPEESRQLKLNGVWYTIEDTSDIYICGKKDSRKNVADLAQFTDFRVNLTPSASGTFNKIKIMCE